LRKKIREEKTILPIKLLNKKGDKSNEVFPYC
jgi:hypothetical protein